MVLHTGDDHSQMNPEILPISFGETVLREEKQLLSCRTRHWRKFYFFTVSELELQKVTVPNRL